MNRLFKPYSVRHFLLLILCFSIIACNDDEPTPEPNPDLSKDITGTYTGSYFSDLENIAEFEVDVVKVDDDTVELKPSSGDNFLAVSVDIESSSETLIISQADQQFDTTASFNIGDEVSLTFNIDPTGFNANFSGSKN